MKIDVLLFAQYRDAFGVEVVSVDVDPGATAASVGEQLRATHPALSRVPVRFAVNELFVQDDHPLVAGDRLAVIPPVSGG